MCFGCSCYSQQHFFMLWEFMSPLAQEFVWRLAEALQLKYNIHPEYLSETQGWNFLKVQLCIRFRSWDLKANYTSAEGARTGRGENRLKQKKSEEQEHLALVDQKTRSNSWVGGGEVTWQLWSRANTTPNRRKEMFFLKQWSRSRNWLRMRTPGRRERGLKVGQSGASTQSIRLVGGKGKDLHCLPWSGASQTDLSMVVSAHYYYCFPQGSILSFYACRRIV